MFSIYGVLSSIYLGLVVGYYAKYYESEEGFSKNILIFMLIPIIHLVLYIPFIIYLLRLKDKKWSIIGKGMAIVLYLFWIDLAVESVLELELELHINELEYGPNESYGVRFLKSLKKLSEKMVKANYNHAHV